MKRNPSHSHAESHPTTTTSHPLPEIFKAVVPMLPVVVQHLQLPPSLLTGTGTTLRFFGTTSSLSDSLVSRFPSTLPLTELGALTPPAIGVCGGVVHGSGPKELDAATLGTFPSVGVGLLVMIPGA
ncbi:MAG: hypothetical protein Q9181_003950 [Wetmoreana brouardii]